MRLGLDIGTSSIGWCLIEDGKRIIDVGVRIFSDGRESSKRLADTLLLLAEVSATGATTDAQGVDLGAIPVVAGGGTTMHRRDCALIAHRDDLTPVGEANAHLTACRVCRPGRG